MSAAENPARMNALDREVMDAGFHGYEGCPLLDPRSEGSCPTPFLCSEKGDCGAAERPDRPAFTDAEVKALARRLMSQVAWHWNDHLSWEDVPLLNEDEWVRLVGALDREAVALSRRAGNADLSDGVDSIELRRQTQ